MRSSNRYRPSELPCYTSNAIKVINFIVCSCVRMMWIYLYEWISSLKSTLVWLKDLKYLKGRLKDNSSDFVGFFVFVFVFFFVPMLYMYIENRGSFKKTLYGNYLHVSKIWSSLSKARITQNYSFHNEKNLSVSIIRWHIVTPLLKITNSAKWEYEGLWMILEWMLIVFFRSFWLHVIYGGEYFGDACHDA